MEVRTTSAAILEALASGDVPLCGDGWYNASEVHGKIDVVVDARVFLSTLESMDRAGKIRLQRSHVERNCEDVDEKLGFIGIYLPSGGSRSVPAKPTE